MSDAPRLVYSPRPDATPEAEHNALAAVYRFILVSHAKRRVTRSVGPDNSKEIADSERGLLWPDK
jgi:hypothetical protein